MKRYKDKKFKNLIDVVLKIISMFKFKNAIFVKPKLLKDKISFSVKANAILPLYTRWR